MRTSGAVCFFGGQKKFEPRQHLTRQASMQRLLLRFSPLTILPLPASHNPVRPPPTTCALALAFATWSRLAVPAPLDLPCRPQVCGHQWGGSTCLDLPSPFAPPTIFHLRCPSLWTHPATLRSPMLSISSPSVPPPTPPHDMKPRASPLTCHPQVCGYKGGGNPR